MISEKIIFEFNDLMNLESKFAGTLRQEGKFVGKFHVLPARMARITAFLNLTTGSTSALETALHTDHAGSMGQTQLQQFCREVVSNFAK